MSSSIREDKVGLTFRGHNPDVLTCIANLSNDEVFTPPELANEMLDAIAEMWALNNGGANIWENAAVTFLDPFTKSGVFLREIVSRLTRGLETVFPNLWERVDHILTKQVFGIGITRLTSLIARRSVYCSKDATSEHSVSTSFNRDWGNIWFERTDHIWSGERCAYCGAAREGYERGDDFETHAYAFIHTSDIKKRLSTMFGAEVQFDVIIGNPPYQLSDGGGGGSALPIYQRFVTQAFALEPRYAMMVTPSRWFSGGRGLNDFRATMLDDRRVRAITDYAVATDAFAGVNINGGVSYFLWNRDSEGDCAVTNVSPGGARGEPIARALNEFDVFVRRNEAVSILRKVRDRGDSTFEHRVSSLKPFGLRTNFHGALTADSSKNIKLYGSGRATWVRPDELTNASWAYRWKVLLPRATDGNEVYPLPIWDQIGPFIAGPGEACTETYLIASFAADRVEAEHIVAYMRTRFFRFMVSLRKSTQDNKAGIFGFVPELPMDRIWDDNDLYERYALTQTEITFIESQVRWMSYGTD